MREVLEETGVEAEFEALTCFRHWHGYRYGKSDIYFVCRLRALSTEIRMGEKEIEECLWMPVQKFMTNEDISPFNKGIVRSALESDGIVPASTSCAGCVHCPPRSGWVRERLKSAHARDARRPDARVFHAGFYARLILNLLILTR